MPAPLPGGSTTFTSGPILGGGGKGSLRGVLPNIYSGYGGMGGYLGGGYSAFDPMNRKKRPMFAQGSAPLPGAGGVDPGSAPAPDNFLRPNPLKMNVYEDYPGFNPLYRGDQLGGMEKQRGANPETLQRLSDATMAYRGLGQRSRGGMGPSIGYGEGLAPDPIKKLLMARYGGGI